MLLAYSSLGFNTQLIKLNQSAGVGHNISNSENNIHVDDHLTSISMSLLFSLQYENSSPLLEGKVMLVSKLWEVHS
jgi:hypothetical protein